MRWSLLVVLVTTILLVSESQSQFVRRRRKKLPVLVPPQPENKSSPGLYPERRGKSHFGAHWSKTKTFVRKSYLKQGNWNWSQNSLSFIIYNLDFWANIMLDLFQSFQCVSRNRIAHRYHSVIHNSKKRSPWHSAWKFVEKYHSWKSQASFLKICLLNIFLLEKHQMIKCYLWKEWDFFKLLVNTLCFSGR